MSQIKELREIASESLKNKPLPKEMAARLYRISNEIEKEIVLAFFHKVDASAQAKMLEPPYKLEGQHLAAMRREIKGRFGVEV